MGGSDEIDRGGPPTSWALSALWIALALLAPAAAMGQGLDRGELELEARRLELDLDSGDVRGEGLRLWGCGGCPSPWSLSARRGVLRRGGDLDLTLPVLWIGRVPVLALPWVRLRTGRRWGLLPPRLGTRAGAGLEVGLGAWGPLGPRASMTVEAAYLSRLAGAELILDLEADRGEIRTEIRAGAAGFDARVTGGGARRWGRLTVTAQLDWTVDPARARGLSRTPAEEARQTERSAAAVIWQGGPLEASLEGELLHDLRGGPETRRYTPTTALRLELLPLRLGPIWLGVSGQAEQRWPLAEEALWSRWFVEASPWVGLTGALGPIAARAQLESRHLSLPAALGQSSRQQVTAAVDLSAPLVRRDGRRRHRLEPAVRYRLCLLDTLEPGLVDELVPELWPVAGHLLWLELRGEVSDGGRAIEATLAQRVGLPTLAGVELEPRLEGRASLRTAGAELELGISVAEREVELGEAWTRARIGQATGLEVSWRWLKEGTEALSGPDRLTTRPTLIPFGALTGGHGLEGRLWTTLGGVVGVEAMGQLDLTHRALLRVGGGVSYRHRCGCLTGSLRAWYRQGRRWPDVLFTLDLSGLSRR